MRTRRDVLKLCVVAAGAAAPGCYRGEGGAPVLGEEETGRYFPQSVASGDPRPESVMLWTRVEDRDSPGEDLRVELVVARDPELEDRLELPIASSQLVVLARFDHCVLVRVAGLEPATTYYYRFRYSSVLGVAESR